MPRVVALSGGVGGAKLVSGLADILAPSDLTAVVNTGDDFIHWGFCIAPDLDTVMYTLAGLAQRVRADPNQRKGEFVLLVQGAGEDANAKVSEGLRLYAKLKDHLPPSTAAKLAAELSGAPRKALYGTE